jgi:Helix-turn-helix domain
MVGSSPTGTPALRTLVPFAKEERISVKEAAAVAGRSERTVRNWCVERGIGRRVGGVWAVSKVALVMWLDGDLAALAAYRDQARAARRSRSQATIDGACSLSSSSDRASRPDPPRPATSANSAIFGESAKPAAPTWRPVSRAHIMWSGQRHKECTREWLAACARAPKPD